MREKRIHNVHRINFNQYRNEAHFLQFQNLHSFNLAKFSWDESFAQERWIDSSKKSICKYMKYLAKLFAGENEMLFVKFIINFAGVLKIEFFFFYLIHWFGNLFNMVFRFHLYFFGFLLLYSKSPFVFFSNSNH